MTNDEQYIDHEVRIRVQEERSYEMKEIYQDIRNTMQHMDNKIDTQFKWTIALIFAMLGGLILTKII